MSNNFTRKQVFFSCLFVFFVFIIDLFAVLTNVLFVLINAADVFLVIFGVLSYIVLLTINFVAGRLFLNVYNY